MNNRRIVIDHNGATYGGQIGTIKSTRLGFRDHGVLTASLTVEWVGGGIGLGGFVLDEPKDREGRDYTRTGTAYGLDHIIRIIETAGVDEWEQLVGQQVIVLYQGESAWGSQSVGFASTTNEAKVLIFKEHAEAWRAAE